MNKKLIFATLKKFSIIFLFIAISTTADASVEDLIASFDFDFDVDILTVLSQTDYMDDLDGNSLNDTLFFNLSLNTSVSDVYAFFIDVEDSNGILTAKDIIPISTGESNIFINMSTDFLTNDTFNYAITAYNSSNALVFRKFRLTTANYPSYDTNFKLLSTSDVNVNNDFIQINTTINATKIETHNVTIFLTFNDSSIKASKEFSFSLGQNIVPLEFDSETIKSTHYLGIYIIDTLTIGNTVILVNTTTATYNFEDFAKTSYFKSYADGTIDEDQDNLTDSLNVNYTLDVKQTDTYLLESKLFDTFNNFIAENSTSLSLSSGITTVELFFQGPAIYQSKTDGPYMIQSAVITNSSGTVVDEVVEPYTLTTPNLTYTDFERPPLPDLTMELFALFDASTSVTTANLTVINDGPADALNVMLDLFDIGNFSWNTTLGQLNASESQSFNFTIEDSANETIAIVDFENAVDEEDETNNIVVGGPRIITSFDRTVVNGLTQIFEFTLQNNFDSAEAFSWNLTTGDENIINSTMLINLTEKEFAFVEVEYTYVSAGNYSVSAIAGNGTIFDSKTILIEVTS